MSPSKNFIFNSDFDGDINDDNEVSDDPEDGDEYEIEDNTGTVIKDNLHKLDDNLLKKFGLKDQGEGGEDEDNYMNNSSQYEEINSEGENNVYEDSEEIENFENEDMEESEDEFDEDSDGDEILPIINEEENEEEDEDSDSQPESDELFNSILGEENEENNDIVDDESEPYEGSEDAENSSNPDIIPEFNMKTRRSLNPSLDNKIKYNFSDSSSSEEEEEVLVKKFEFFPKTSVEEIPEIINLKMSPKIMNNYVKEMPFKKNPPKRKVKALVQNLPISEDIDYKELLIRGEYETPKMFEIRSKISEIISEAPEDTFNMYQLNGEAIVELSRMIIGKFWKKCVYDESAENLINIVVHSCPGLAEFERIII